MKKVLFVTSRVVDARELTYRAQSVWSVTVPSDLANAPALAATGNFDFALFDIGLAGAWAPDLLRAVIAARAGLPVFILSREYALPFQALAREAGAADYISIPYAFLSLKKRVDRVLDSPDSRVRHDAVEHAPGGHGARVAPQAVIAHEASPRYGQAEKAAREGKTAPAQSPTDGAPRTPTNGAVSKVAVGSHAGTMSHSSAGNPAGAVSYADTVGGEGDWCDDVSGKPCIIGHSDAMAALRTQLQSIRDTTETVLITGETGSGKDLVARMIHDASSVSAGPFIPCNVSCIPESLAESVLFGSCRGSYTGSVRDVLGLFEAATGGTLFLDEIGELSLALQPRLLRVLEEGAVCRIGSFERRPVRFRLICATHRDLAAMVAARRFRSDLFYRLDVLRVESPPLRSHPEDIPALASRCLLRHRKVLSPRALEKLKGYPWPGNVRQLYACLSRAACATRDTIIDCDLIEF